MSLAPGTRVHIVGVAGAGMSALAILLAESGCLVSGCDQGNAAVLAELAERGVAVSPEHDASHVDDADVVLWSPAVRVDHPELAAARAAGREMMARPAVLAELASRSRLVGLTGTHGKTTATSMLVCIMAAAGRDDARLVGAAVRGVGANGHWGPGDLLCEVDESYGAFAELAPYALGLLNVEADHLDHYGSLAKLESAFAAVLDRCAGPVVVWSDDPGVRRVVALSDHPVIPVGTADAEWTVSRSPAAAPGMLTRFRLSGERELDVELRVPGAHNIANAAVAAVLALQLGVEPEAVRRGLAAFSGAPRRFELRGRWRGATVIDDYAHLPGEIAATVAAARDLGYERLAAVFQPHRVTRTAALADDYAPAFDALSCVVITDIYRAGEENPEGLTGEVVAGPIRRRGASPVYYGATLADAAAELREHAGDVEALLVLGAGDVTGVLDFLELDDAATDHFWGEDPRVEYDADLGACSTYRVGGSVTALVTLASLEDLDEMSERLASSPRPLWPIGNGSNLLVADGRHDAVAVRLAGDFDALEWRDDGDAVLVVAGAAMDLPVAARRLGAEGIRGFEWAVGVPGSFGGAVSMNAGGHGSDMRASVTRVEVWARGTREWRDAAALDFGYRRSALAPGEIVTRVEMRLRRGDAAAAKAEMSEIVRWRREHQPGGANAGSVFANPEGDSAGRLIELAGLKGLRRGRARVSDKHANFIIADPDATAADVAALIGFVRDTVAQRCGVTLVSEHRFLGFERAP